MTEKRECHKCHQVIDSVEGKLTDHVRRWRGKMVACRGSGATGLKALTEKLTPETFNAIRFRVMYSFHQTARGVHPDGYHAITLEPINKGRLERRLGDPICRPKNDFRSDFAEAKGVPVTCRRCVELLMKLRDGEL